jgi:hypothetical protein
MMASTVFFDAVRVLIAFVGVLCSLLFDLRTIGLIVVKWVGGKAYVLSFSTDGFVGGFRRVGVGFVTTFTVFEPLVFPNVFAALESGFLPADTFFKGGCSGWVTGLRFRVAWIVTGAGQVYSGRSSYAEYSSIQQAIYGQAVKPTGRFNDRT